MVTGIRADMRRRPGLGHVATQAREARVPYPAVQSFRTWAAPYDGGNWERECNDDTAASNSHWCAAQ